MKSKIMSVYNSLYGSIIFIAILTVLLYSLYLNFNIIIVVILCFFLDRISFDKVIIIFSIIITLLIIIGYQRFINKEIQQTKIIQCTVVEINNVKDDAITTICKGKKETYYVKIINSQDNIKIGYIITSIDFEEKEVEGPTLPNLFNFKNYLYGNGIKKYIQINDYDINNIDYKCKIRRLIDDYIKTNFDEKTIGYLNALILGDTNYLNKDIEEAIVNIGLMHLFVVSGMHIHLIIGYLDLVLKRLYLTKEQRLSIYTIFVFGYGYILNFPPSIERVFLYYLLLSIFRYSDIKTTKMDVVSLSLLLTLIIKPYYIHNIGFILSYLATFVIVLSLDLIKGNKILNTLIISTIVYYFTLPIIININNQINLLTPVFNVFFIFYVSILLLPASFITILIPKFEPIYDIFISIFNKILLLCNNDMVLFSISNLSNTIIIIYYIIITIIIIRIYLRQFIQCFYLLFVLIILLGINSKLIFSPQIYFLDVGQGDSTLLVDKFQTCNILIDTGSDSEYLLSNLSQFYLKTGIDKIDYLILTHSDNDHSGQSANLIESIQVKNLVVNKNDTSIDMKAITEVAEENNTNIIKVEENYTFKCGSYQVDIIAYQGYESNDMALISKISINGIKLLILGDLSLKYSEEITEDIDILKVSHHGSKNNTSDKLLNNTTPEYAIISVGSNNIYHHPNEEVINILNNNNVKIYRTDKQGTIKLKIIKKNIIIKTLK